MNAEPETSKLKSNPTNWRLIAHVGFLALSVILALGTDEMRELLEEIAYLLTTTTGVNIISFLVLGVMIFWIIVDIRSRGIDHLLTFKLIPGLLAMVVMSFLIGGVLDVLYRIILSLLGVMSAGIMLINAPNVLLWLHHAYSVRHIREEWQGLKEATDIAKVKK
jgi:hypothetical protein